MTKIFILVCTAALSCLATATFAQSQDLKEKMATVINLNGQLCARVESIRPAGEKDMYNVECIRYRDGTGKATYLVNARTGQAK